MIQVAILAGGLGTRLGPATSQMPKALVPVNGRPFFAHVLDLLAERGLKRILVCVGHHAEQLERAFGDGGEAGVQLTWHRDGPRLLGTGGALRAALDRLEEEFLVLYGDTYLDIDYGAVVRAFRASEKPALMTVFRNSGRFDTSNVVFRDGRLVLYSKRQRTPEMDYIDYGLAALRREVIAELPAGEPSDLGDLYSRLVQEGRMAGHEVFRRFYEIGTPAGLAETERYLAARR
jgi:N-acetyl-alpha-D-muramate 1-phosphate uridylyltransferase